MNAKVSVILPCYNAEKYLEQSILSILNQTYQYFELIIINDGSTDNSTEILEKYAKSDNRIIIINQSNEGIVSALNKGIRISTGKYCARMDADDIAIIDRIEKQVNFLENNPNIFVVGGQGYVIDEDGDKIRPLTVLTNHNDIDRDLLNNFNKKAMIHPAVMFRTHEISMLGGYREEFIWAEDLDLFLRVSEIGKLANLQDTVLYYRINTNGITNTKNSTQRINAIKAVDEARSRRNLEIIRHETKINNYFLEKPSDQMYDTAITALSNGWINTAEKYSKKMLLEHGISLNALKILIKVLIAKNLNLNNFLK